MKLLTWYLGHRFVRCVFFSLIAFVGCRSSLGPAKFTNQSVSENQRSKSDSFRFRWPSSKGESIEIRSIADREISLENPLLFQAPFEGPLPLNTMDGLQEESESGSIWERLWSDQKNFYSAESLSLLGGGVLIGGAMANSSIDEGIQRHFQSSVRGATSDEWFESLHASKELGNGMYTLPVFASAWAAGELLPDNRFAETSGRWGERSLRGFVAGAPPLIALQQLTGGSRPMESSSSSNWQPFQDVNGVSGHSFMGSLPFITAAKMTDNLAYKSLFYAGSAIAPLSRVNDNAHYPSQVALGWWMAYLAASAVNATDNPQSKWRFYPYFSGDGTGVMAEMRF